MKLIRKPMKIKSRYYIERSKEPEGLNTHILYYEREGILSSGKGGLDTKAKRGL